MPTAPAIAPPPVLMTRDLVAEQIHDMVGLPNEKALEIVDHLIDLGIVVEGVPACRRVFTDAQTFVERAMLAELTVRLFRFYVLGNIVLPDTPAAMDWLKSFIDGSPDQGPLGAGPMLWPVMVSSADAILRRWGFEPTPGPMPYVIKRRPA